MGLLDMWDAAPGSAQDIRMEGLLGGLTELGARMAKAGQFRPVGQPGPDMGDAFAGFGAGQKDAVANAMQMRTMQQSTAREAAWRDAATGKPTTPAGMQLFNSVPEKNRSVIFAMDPKQGMDTLGRIVSQRPVAAGPGQVIHNNDGTTTRVPWTAEDMAAKREGAPRVSNHVTMDMKAETEFEKAFGKQQAEEAIALIAAGNTAQGTLDTVSRMRELSKDMKFGKLAGVATTLTAFGQAVGVSPERLKSLGLAESATNAELFGQLETKMAMGMIGPGGMPANNFSENDWRVVKGAVPNMLQRPETVAAGLDAIEKIAKRNQEATRSFNKARMNKVPFDQWQRQWAEHVNNNPLFPGGTPGTALPTMPTPTRAAPRAGGVAAPTTTPSPRVTYQQWEALPKGSKFIAEGDPTGKERVKE